MYTAIENHRVFYIHLITIIHQLYLISAECDVNNAQQNILDICQMFIFKKKMKLLANI